MEKDKELSAAGECSTCNYKRSYCTRERGFLRYTPPDRRAAGARLSARACWGKTQDTEGGTGRYGLSDDVDDVLRDVIGKSCLVLLALLLAFALGRLGADLLVVLLKGSQVLTGLRDSRAGERVSGIKRVD